MIGRIAIVFLRVIAGEIEIQRTKYFLVETIHYDNGSRLNRYLKAFDNLSDGVHERAASPRYVCVAAGPPGDDARSFATGGTLQGRPARAFHRRLQAVAYRYRAAPGSVGP
jgi:hypothetical protein